MVCNVSCFKNLRFIIIFLQGLKCIESFIGPKRRVQVPKEDLIILLSHQDPSCPSEIEKYSQATQEAFNGIGMTKYHMMLFYFN